MPDVILFPVTLKVTELGKVIVNGEPFPPEKVIYVADNLLKHKTKTGTYNFNILKKSDIKFVDPLVITGVFIIRIKDVYR